jgi:hypothetical protein
MKLWAVSMVRNEADVIEAFVRHNLAFLDGIAILDHASIDSTIDILTRLKAEGLPIFRLRTAQTAFAQGHHVTALVRECFARTDADFVFALDADEFISADSRDRVEQALSAIPPGSYGRHFWRTYVPTSFDKPFGQHCLEYRVREERHPKGKMILGRSFASKDEMVSDGSHWVFKVPSGEVAPIHDVDAALLRLAHCPVRSRTQLESKVRLGYEALREARGANTTTGFHWRDLYEDVARGVELSDSRLRVIAANYGAQRSQWLAEGQIDLVHDPVRLRGTSAA